MKLPKPNFYNSKLRNKILISILSIVLLAFLTVFSYIIIKNEKISSLRAFRYVEASAREHANLLKSQLESDFSICRTIKLSYSDYRSYSREERAKMYNNTMKSVLENNKQFISVWTSWELSNIDESYKKEDGRESFVIYKEGNKIKYKDEIIDTTGTPTGLYYDIKANPTEILTEPYYYSYTGDKRDEILEASICIPMFEKGKYIGLVGADVELERFDKILHDISPFDGSYSLLISSEGMLFNHSGGKELKNNVSIGDMPIAAKLDFDIKKRLAEGNDFSYRTTLDENEYYVTFSPLTLGKSGKYWYLGIVVPVKTILADARAETVISLIIAFIGLLVVALVIWWLARTITFPLLNTTRVLKLLAKGNVDEVHELDIRTKDELAVMAEAVNTVMKTFKSSAIFANNIGEGKLDSEYKSLGEKDILGNSLLQMRDKLREYNLMTSRNQWLQKSIVKISAVLQGEKTFNDLGNDLLSAMAEILNVQIGAVYVNTDKVLKLTASYAYNKRKSSSNSFKLGEGLVGQAALEQKILLFDKLPDDYISIKSGLGESKPSSIIIIPLIYEHEVVGVVELGTSYDFGEDKMDFIRQISENVAIAFRSISLRTKMEELLGKTQEQAEELRVQQEELVEANSVLKSQTEALRVSEEELQQQQEELRVTNEELEEKTKHLEKQKAYISEKNLDLENARKDLERKADELGVASKYKSDFLANMSHELRTPLNSLLILSRDLADNSTKNLTKEQTEAAEIIYKSGSDLLSMINDILDLSKIESGKMTVNIEDVELAGVGDTVVRYFKHLTDQKGISLQVIVEDDVPAVVRTDQQKLEQILKNFVSNGIKFTNKGGIVVRFHNIDGSIVLNQSGLSAKNAFAVSVEDTGLGIPKEKQAEIFEAFRQADTSISKNFGGTGLGLSISKELAKLLGGEIGLSSKLDEGSSFTVYLPLDFDTKDGAITRAKSNKAKKNKKAPISENANTKTAAASKISVHDNSDRIYVPDDREEIKEGDSFILIVEDDPEFAKILVKECNSNKFKCIAVESGEQGLEIAKTKNPAAIILDINLPGINGWAVMKILKDNPGTRHIPVHIMSGDDAKSESNKSGAIGFLQKPVDRKSINSAFDKIQNYISKDVRNLLIVEDDENLRHAIKKIIGVDGIEITDADNGQHVLELLASQSYDCMILDLGLPDMSGFELIEKIQKENIHKPPIIVYTGKDISKEENEMLEKYAETVIIKGVKSADRLLDETSLFMHRVVAQMPDKQKDIINNLYERQDAFKGKKVLVVDDDMRNVFALSSVLNKNGLKVFRAENGRVALDVLAEESDMDIILMDIMMPVMDGFEAMTKIRKLKNFKRTPIIALTAKAMKGDKQKCIDAGASDYMAKPIDVDKLLSLMRVWLYK
ncbi:MAG: response regulator [Chlorobi bacterium]|nr:response regulator [Chlorobiota bacterium]